MDNQKKKITLVIGGSENPSRYANRAVHKLINNGHKVIVIGRKEGKIEEVDIQIGFPELKNIDTITLYINPLIQVDYEDYILSLNPKRIIFNPGTENPSLIKRAKEKGILTEIGCTLVMLSVDEY